MNRIHPANETTFFNEQTIRFPRVSNEPRRVSNQIQKMSNKLRRMSNQTAKVSNEPWQVSNQTPKVSNKAVLVPNHTPQSFPQSNNVKYQISSIES